jgi:hypothetical protein
MPSETAISPRLLWHQISTLTCTHARACAYAILMYVPLALLQTPLASYWLNETTNPEVGEWRAKVGQYLGTQGFKEKWEALKAKVRVVCLIVCV